MYIKLKDNYYNLEHVANISINKNTICVLSKNQTSHDFISYKTPAEALVAFEKVAEMIERYNLSKSI